VFTLSTKAGGPSDVLDGTGKPVSEDDARAVRAAVRGFKRLGAFVVSLPRDPMKPGTTVDVAGEGLRGLLGEGDDKMSAATFAYRTYAYAMLAGTFVTMAGFVPVGFAASSAGEYTFTLFAVVAIGGWFFFLRREARDDAATLTTHGGA
jgi:hypothetical protein